MVASKKVAKAAHSYRTQCGHLDDLLQAEWGQQHGIAWEVGVGKAAHSHLAQRMHLADHLQAERGTKTACEVQGLHANGRAAKAANSHLAQCRHLADHLSRRQYTQHMFLKDCHKASHNWKKKKKMMMMRV
jgi:hypothetical protein